LWGVGGGGRDPSASGFSRGLRAGPPRGRRGGPAGAARPRRSEPPSPPSPQLFDDPAASPAAPYTRSGGDGEGPGSPPRGISGAPRVGLRRESARRASPAARTRLASLWCCRLCVCDLGFANADIRFSGTTVMVRPVPVDLCLPYVWQRNGSSGPGRACPMCGRHVPGLARSLARAAAGDLAWQIASVDCHIISEVRLTTTKFTM
jgi:hypothetical protein